MARSPCCSGSPARAGTAARRSIFAGHPSAKTGLAQSFKRVSEAADIERARAFAAAALDDAFAAVLGRAAVIAVMSALVVQIGRLRLCSPPSVADDLDGVTRHCRLR